MNSSGIYAILMFYSDLGCPKIVRNDQLSMEFWECGITDKVSKVVSFENTYLWVTFGKISFLVYLCSYIYSLFLKSSFKK